MVGRITLLCLLVCGCCPSEDCGCNCGKPELPSIDVDAIAVSLRPEEVAEEPAPVPAPVPVAEPEYRVVMYSATWCGPCQRWKSNEKKKVSGTLVIKEYSKGAPEGIRYWPTFIIEKVEGDKVTEVKRFEGYTSAAKLNAEIK